MDHVPCVFSHLVKITTLHQLLCLDFLLDSFHEKCLQPWGGCVHSSHMNFSYGYNVVTSIHQIKPKKKPVELRVGETTLREGPMGYVSLEKSLDWLPWVEGDSHLNFKPDQLAWRGWKGPGGGQGPTKYRLYEFEKFLDTENQYGKIVNYLEGTTFLKQVDCSRNVQIVTLDNPNHFKDFYAENTARLLAVLCGCEQKILFSATISHRGFVSTTKQKSLMLRNVRMFGKKMVLADHIWVNYTQRWSVAEPLLGDKKVYVLGKVVQYRRKDGSVDYSIKASKVFRA